MIRRNCSLALTISLALVASAFACRGASLKVGGLKCEYRVNPLGLDTPRPRLSWLLESSQRGDRQTAYQVLVGILAGGAGQGQRGFMGQRQGLVG